MKTNNGYAGPKCIDGGEHDWRIGRERGSRVRWECSKCLHLDPWTKKSEAVSSQAQKTIEKIDRLIEKADTIDTLQGYAKMTVAELRDIAKVAGITGYSKMKKSELVAALATIEQSGELVGAR